MQIITIGSGDLKMLADEASTATPLSEPDNHGMTNAALYKFTEVESLQQPNLLWEQQQAMVHTLQEVGDQPLSARRPSTKTPIPWLQVMSPFLIPAAPIHHKPDQSLRHNHDSDDTGSTVNLENQNLLLADPGINGYPCPVIDYGSHRKLFSTPDEWCEHLISAHGDTHGPSITAITSGRDKKTKFTEKRKPNTNCTPFSIGQAALYAQRMIKCHVAGCETDKSFRTLHALGTHLLSIHKDMLDCQPFNKSWQEQLTSAFKPLAKWLKKTENKNVLQCKECSYRLDLRNNQTARVSVIRHSAAYCPTKKKLSPHHLGHSSNPLSLLDAFSAGERYQARHGGGLSCREHPEILNRTFKVFCKHIESDHTSELWQLVTKIESKLFCPVKHCRLHTFNFITPARLFSHFTADHVTNTYNRARRCATFNNWTKEELLNMIHLTGCVYPQELDFNQW